MESTGEGNYLTCSSALLWGNDACPWGMAPLTELVPGAAGTSVGVAIGVQP